MRRLVLALLLLILPGEACAQGTLTIPNVFSGKAAAPIAQFDQNWSAIAAYVNGMLLFGTIANRPTAGVATRLYFATDQNGGTAYIDNGSTWTAIAAGAASGGIGVDASTYSSLSAAITAQGTASKTIIISTTQTVTGNLTVPANISLFFTNGGQLSIPTGVTVTIVGPMLAPQAQIFVTAGTGKVVFNGSTGLTVGSLLYSFPVVWWGARFDQAESTGTISNGQATLVNTGGVLFAATDVGKTIVVKGAGAAGANLITTISTFTDTTHVTLAANASTSVVGSGMNWGTDDAAAIQAGLNAIPVSSTLQFPTGTSMVKTGLTTLGGINIVGTGMGIEHSRLNYVATSGSLLSILNNGYINTHLADFSIENSGGIATPVGIDVTWTRVHIDRMGVIPYSVAATGFAVGIRFNQIGACGKTFDNSIRDTYIGQNTVGVDLRGTDDTTLDSVYLENNLTNVRVGADCASSHITIVNSNLVLNGAVMGTGGIGVDVQQTTSLVIRDSRFETDLGQSATYHASVAISMGTVSANTNTIIEGNLMNGDGVADRLIYVQGGAANTSNLTLRGNYFYRTTVAVEFVNANVSVDIGPNAFTNSTTYLKIAGVNDPNTKYSLWAADTQNPARFDSIVTLGTSQAGSATSGDIVAKFGQGLRNVSNGGGSTFKTAQRALIGAGEVVQIAGSGDTVAIDAPASVAGAGAGDAVLKNTAALRAANNAGNSTVRLIEKDTSDVVHIAGGANAVKVDGPMTLVTFTFANISTTLTANGQIGYCSDCDPVTAVDQTCASAGAKTGNMAMRLNGVYKCAF